MAAGQVVTIQARPVTRQDWVGTGYVARQPKTGESSYLLSGEVVTSGGLTIVRSSQWPDPETADALRHPDSPKTVDVADVSPGTTGELELYDPAWQTILVGAVAPAGLRARIRLASGSAVKGAHVVFTTENGQTRCFKTRAEADQFSKDLDALTSSAAVRARVMASPASLDVVTSEPLALAEAFCVAGPLLGDSYIVTPDPTWESPRALGFGEVRTRWVRQKGVDVVARQPFQLLANPRETVVVELGPSSLPAVPTGMPAPFALIARLRDRFGNPEAKAAVDWTSTQVGGQFRAAGGTTSRTATGIDGTTSVGYIVGGQPGAVTITARTVNALSKELRATVGFGALDAGASDCVLTVAYDPPDIGLQGVVGTAMPFTIAATPIGRSAIGGGTFTATLTAADGKTLDVASGESGSAVRLSYLMQPDTFALIRTSMGDCVAPPPRRVYAAGVTLATERILVDGTVLPLEPRPFCAGTLDPLAPVSEECFECIMTGCNGRPEYLSRHWTGIDCIGLVYASEQYAVHAAVVGGAAAEVLEGLINPPLSDMSAEFTTLNERNSVGGFYVPDHSFPAASVAASGAVYFVHAAPSAIKDHTGVVRRGMAAFARRGDLMVTAKHIQIAYSDGVLTIPPSEAGGKPWSIEAAGPQDQTYGRKKQLFGRKALVRPLDDEAYQPAIVVREILWH